MPANSITVDTTTAVEVSDDTRQLIAAVRLLRQASLCVSVGRAGLDDEQYEYVADDADRHIHAAIDKLSALVEGDI